MTLTADDILKLRNRETTPDGITNAADTETTTDATGTQANSTSPVNWSGTTLAQLRNQLLGNYTPYEAQDEATLRERAEGMYKPQYEYDLSNLRSNLNSQLASQGRSALTNGMQRSSWNSAMKGKIRNNGLMAEAQLGTQYAGNVTQQLQNMLTQEQNRVLQDQQYRDNLMLQLYSLQKA